MSNSQQDRPVVYLKKVVTHFYEIHELEFVDIGNTELVDDAECVVCDNPINTSKQFGIGKTELHGDVLFDETCYNQALQKLEENKAEWKKSQSQLKK